MPMSFRNDVISRKEGILMKRIAVLMVAMMAFGCAHDAKGFKITADNQEKFMDEIRDYTLTVGESQALYGYIMRNGMAAGLAGKKMNLAGKTIGDIIKEQQEWQAAEDKRKTEEERLAAEAKAREEAAAKRLREALMCSVYKKDFQKADFMSGQYKDFLSLGIALKNKSGKDIRAFKGKFVVDDLLGDHLFDFELSATETLKAGLDGTASWSWEYNQFNNKLTTVKNTPVKDLKITWVPSQILFVDGSKLE